MSMIESSIVEVKSIKPDEAEDAKRQKSRLEKACKDFEALFISQMLKIMREASGGESGGLSMGDSPFQGMFDWELSRVLSEKAPLGISKMMMSKMTAQMDFGLKDGDPQKKVDLESEQMQSLIDQAASKHGIEPELIRAVIVTESNARPELVSDKGAKGLMQLMDDTAGELGVDDPFQPDQNIEGGSAYLSGLMKRYNNDLTLALAAYNAGPSKVDQYEGIPPYAETRDYVQRVLKEYSETTRNLNKESTNAQSGDHHE